MEKTNHAKFGLFTLVAIAVGNVVGAGIVTTTGLAIGKTGQSVWIAYGLAVILGAVWLLPYILFSSFAKYRGAAYTQVVSALGELTGGIYIVLSLPLLIMIGTVGAATGVYIHAIFPAIPQKLASIGIITLVYILNLFGVNVMAKVERPMTVALIAMLMVFAALGLTKLRPDAMAITQSSYYLNGGAGLFAGFMLLIYSTGGHGLIVAHSMEAKKPYKDISKSILISTAVIFVLYVSVSFAAGNVLPVEEVAGQPLTYVAQKLFPGFFYYLFIFAGPLMALLTSVNAAFPLMTAGHVRAAKNGWLPACLAKTNKHGAPWVLYTLVYAIAVVPLILNVSLSTFTAFTVMSQRILGVIFCATLFTYPKKFKKHWEKSWLHMPNGVFYVLSAFALLSQAAIVCYSILNLSKSAFIGNIIMTIVLAGYAVIRYKTGKTTTSIGEIVFVDEDPDAC